MKFLRLFLLSIFCTFAYPENVTKEINQKAAELLKNNPSFEDEEELLFTFYSQEIAKLDLETLKQNPELVFRRAYYLDAPESIEKLQEHLQRLEKDSRFVLENAEADSRLFKIAQFQNSWINYVLENPFQNMEEALERSYAFIEKILRQWSSNPSATGKQLREDILLHIENHPEAHQAFLDFILMTQEPDIALGYIQPEKIKIKGIVTKDDGISKIAVSVTYHPAPGHTITSKIKL